MLTLPIETGLLSAYYFLLFDLILLTLLDNTLSLILSHFHYHRIRNGLSLELRSCDIPGLSTFMLGSCFSLPNIIALLVKTSALVLILIMDLNIFADMSQPVHLMSTFSFNMSDLAFPRDRAIVVERRWDAVRRCNTPEYRYQEATFFHVAFNLSADHRHLVNEIQPPGSPYVAIDDRSVVCLSPKFVKSPQPSAKVVGCSSLGRRSPKCEMNAPVRRTVGTHPDMQVYNITMDGLPTVYTYGLHIFPQHMLTDVFPEYLMNPLPIANNTKSNDTSSVRSEAKMTCLSTLQVINDTAIIPFTWCLVTVVQNGTTLIERWNMDRNLTVVSRVKPGPVFRGEMDIGVYPKVRILLSAFREVEFITMASYVVASSAAYRLNASTQHLVIGRHTRSKIPNFAAVIAALLVIFILISRLVAYIIIERRTNTPLLNTVHGLSTALYGLSLPSIDTKDSVVTAVTTATLKQGEENRNTCLRNRSRSRTDLETLGFIKNTYGSVCIRPLSTWQETTADQDTHRQGSGGKLNHLDCQETRSNEKDNGNVDVSSPIDISDAGPSPSSSDLLQKALDER